MDIKKMNGEELFRYYTNGNCPESDYSDIVELLPYACPDKNKAFQLLKDITEQGKKLVAIYPGVGEKPRPGMKFIGSIPDGDLYIE